MNYHVSYKHAAENTLTFLGDTNAQTAMDAIDVFLKSRNFKDYSTHRFWVEPATATYYTYNVFVCDGLGLPTKEYDIEAVSISMAQKKAELIWGDFYARDEISVEPTGESVAMSKVPNEEDEKEDVFWEIVTDCIYEFCEDLTIDEAADLVLTYRCQPRQYKYKDPFMVANEICQIVLSLSKAMAEKYTSILDKYDWKHSKMTTG